MARIGLALAMAALLVAGFTTPTRACSSDQVTFEAAVADADAIARIVVVDVPTSHDDRADETWRVTEVISGSIPLGEIVMTEPYTSYCRDTVGYFATEGGEAIVAFDVPFLGTIVHPMWIETGDLIQPIFATVWDMPSSARTLDDVEALIRGALPNTAVPAPAVPPLHLVGAALLLASPLLALRRRATRRAEETTVLIGVALRPMSERGGFAARRSSVGASARRSIRRKGVAGTRAHPLRRAQRSSE